MLDVAKFICALLVIVIHTRPFCDISDILDFYVSDVIARIAVPLFFAISGYLFFGNLNYQNGKIKKCTENRKKLLAYLKKNLIIYLDCSIVYFIFQLPQWYQMGWWGKVLIKDYLVAFFFKGTYYHLWYLIAVIYAFPLLYLLRSRISKKNFQRIILCLWIGECLLYSYDWIGTDRISWLMRMQEFFSACFDAVFRALPLIGIGVLCIDNHEKPKRNSGVFAVLAFLVCAVEALVLRFYTPNHGKYSYILFTPIMTYFILNWLVCNRKKGNPVLGILFRKSSLAIYCLHPLVIKSLELAGVKSHFHLWIFVTIISVGIAFIWTIVKGQLQQQRIILRER